ncbi:MAG: outer membrane protein assembly factor BamD [Aquificota bacterium]|nr:outer membrane protein assembly factor BamD [Aquificota bacterium]
MRRGIYIFLLFLVLLSGCAKMSEAERANRAQEYYAQALRDYKEGDYGDAAWNLNEALKYMDYLTPKQIENAKFLLAKSYYLDEEYVDAVVSLEDYIFYYPKLSRTEEAYYLLVDSYVKIAPDPYRDQEYTWKAIDKAKEFLSRFPKSGFAPKVQKLITEAYKKIAKHEYYIAKFYEDYGYTYSAALRYREILINFAQYVSEPEIAYRYIRCLLLTDRQVELERDKIKNLIEETEDRLSSAEDEEEKKAIKNRLSFLRGELKRWEEIGKRAQEEAMEAITKYKEVYGHTKYYRELEKILKEKGWKS